MPAIRPPSFLACIYSLHLLRRILSVAAKKRQPIVTRTYEYLVGPWIPVSSPCPEARLRNFLCCSGAEPNDLRSTGGGPDWATRIQRYGWHPSKMERACTRERLSSRGVPGEEERRREQKKRNKTQRRRRGGGVRIRCGESRETAWSLSNKGWMRKAADGRLSRERC